MFHITQDVWSVKLYGCVHLFAFYLWVVQLNGRSIQILEVVWLTKEFYSDDEHLTSVSEFPVYKVHKARHAEPMRRTLCLSETCILERDPQTYSICTLRPLSDIFALIRDTSNPQLFNIEYINGLVRTYTATDRWGLIYLTLSLLLHALFLPL